MYDYTVLVKYQGTELLVYPNGEIAFFFFSIFVGVALVINLICWAYSTEAFFRAVGWMALFAFGTTVFTVLAAVGCIKDGCRLVDVMAMAQPWGWAFAALAFVAAVVTRVVGLFR